MACLWHPPGPSVRFCHKEAAVDELSDPKFKPPYLSFQTFWGFVKELAAKPLPPQIDRTMLDKKSGTDQMNLDRRPHVHHRSGRQVEGLPVEH